MKKISVFLITYCEEANVRRCLDSVKWADEIVVVDSFSTDKTADICKEFTDKVYKRKFTDFADMKNFALSKASCEWVLSIDADEVVTDELRQRIAGIVEKDDNAVSGYYIKRRSSIFGRWFSCSGTQDDFQMRLFKKGAAKYCQPVHEKVSMTGRTGRISEPLLHYTYNDISGYVNRLNRYTDMEAAFLSAQGKKSGILLITLKPFLRFVNLYFFKQGFRDGIEGFIFCASSGIYDLVKYVKLWNIAKEPPQAI